MQGGADDGSLLSSDSENREQHQESKEDRNAGWQNASKRNAAAEASSCRALASGEEEQHTHQTSDEIRSNAAAFLAGALADAAARGVSQALSWARCQEKEKDRRQHREIR